jgi:hypothetical protein
MSVALIPLASYSLRRQLDLKFEMAIDPDETLVVALNRAAKDKAIRKAASRRDWRFVVLTIFWAVTLLGGIALMRYWELRQPPNVAEYIEMHRIQRDAASTISERFAPEGEKAKREGCEGTNI